MSRVRGSHVVLASAVAVGIVALTFAVVMALVGFGVISLGEGSRPPATYAGGSPGVVPQTDKEEGCPTDGTSLAGSRLTINDPSGKAIVDTALDCNHLEQQLGSDEKYHVTPGILPGFWYLRDRYELPRLGHESDTWVLVGHTGPEEAHAPFTGMVGLPQLTSYVGYVATLVTPLGTERLGIQLADTIGNSDITRYLEEAQKTPGARYVAGCRVVDGQIVDQTVIVKLVPIESL